MTIKNTDKFDFKRTSSLKKKMNNRIKREVINWEKIFTIIQVKY